ncbi:MAG: hypothetical protein H9882_00430 [Candidatus Fournierella pullistercoris]|uniref:Uncharacterized protein n=1 Tax=Candidatus Allofournierella pullistercoris TaxID=2838597 RepID=A0A948WQ30_9FIRM|nr:hypothetical protein [Candidatus Fournierella pullistercoris]
MHRAVRIILKLFAVLSAVGLCALLYLFSFGYFAPVPTVGYLSSERQLPYLDLEALESELATQEISFLPVAVNQQDYATAVNTLLEAKVNVVVVSTDSGALDETLLSMAKENGLSLILVGSSPSDELIASYDKMWYVGSEPSLAGETLGNAIKQASEQGVVLDANGDHLLQYAYYLSEDGPYYQTMVESALEQGEHYGLFHQQLLADAESGEPLAFDTATLVAQPQPELILATNEADLRTVHQVAQELGWLTNETPTALAAIAPNVKQAETLMAENLCFAVAYYDLQAVTETVAELAENSVNSSYAGEDMLRCPDETGRFYIPFGMISNLPTT